MKSSNTKADYEIKNADQNDLDTICMLFEEAISFQKTNHYTGWNNYDRNYLLADIEKGLLFKIIQEESIICTFCICYSDELIWREMEKGNALYLHRIVLNRQYKGEKVFKKVLDWAISHACEKKLDLIRMDTWASNGKIISYYESYGFRFIENYTTPDTEDLPIQHRNLEVALLEFDLLLLQRSLQTKVSDKVNIDHELAAISQYWDQKIIGNANGQLIKLAKGIGEINWHKHDDQDELFIVHKGHLTIQLREKNIELFKNEMFIVQKGIEHCPKAVEETEFIIMGLNITSNTAGGRPGNWSHNYIK